MVLVVAITTLLDRKVPKFNLWQFVTLGVFAVYWGFRFFQTSLWHHDERGIEFLKSALVELSALVFLFWAFVEPRRSYHITRYFCVFLAVAGTSSFISFIISAAGFSERIVFAHLPRDPAAPDLMVYTLQFPFSVSYGELIGISRRVFYRYTSGFAEAGIYPAFAFWAILIQVTTRRINVWLIAGVLLGVVASFATAALLCLGVAVTVGAIWIIVRRLRGSAGVRIPLLFVPIFLAAGSVLFMLYAPDLGMRDKEQGQKKSVSDRADNISRGINSLDQNVLGRDASRDSEHGGICLLAETYGLGLVGLILWLTKMGLLVFRRNEDWLAIAVCFSPLLLTLAVSQPIYDYCPAVLLSLLARHTYNTSDDPLSLEPHGSEL